MDAFNILECAGPYEQLLAFSIRRCHTSTALRKWIAIAQLDYPPIQDRPRRINFMQHEHIMKSGSCLSTPDLIVYISIIIAVVYVWSCVMAFETAELDCNIFGDFKIGDNTRYNANILSELVAANEGGIFNKLIVLQAASIIEVAAIQIFYRATNYTREGVPNISVEDREEISGKQIDKFAVIVDNLKKYKILDGLGSDVYGELHKLRKYRNKIHIQSDVDLPSVLRDEDYQFSNEIMEWAVGLNWKILAYLEANFARPKSIRGYVRPLRLPRPC